MGWGMTLGERDRFQRNRPSDAARVLLVGNRAIQHALATRLAAESCRVEVYPGQPCGLYESVSASQVARADYDLVVIGSPRYFRDPVIEDLRRRGQAIFGPDLPSSLLETSKSHFKEFAASAGVPTPASRSFASYEDAAAYIAKVDGPYVIKADGPARGCGVSIAVTVDEALTDLHRKLRSPEGLYAADSVVVEDYVEGVEVAVNVFLDGETYLALPATRPHKRRDADNKGPHVAGMGSVTPLPLGERFARDLDVEVMKPTLKAMQERGHRFRGCLFINLMMNEEGLTVLEFNCRMGDPAMLVNLALLRSSVIDLLTATVEGRIAGFTPDYAPGAAVAVTLTDPGYPDSSEPLVARITVDPEEWLSGDGRRGLVLAGAERQADGRTYQVVNGVVASALGSGPNVALARRDAYALAARHPELHSRLDIGLDLSLPRRYVEQRDPRHVRPVEPADAK